MKTHQFKLAVAAVVTLLGVVACKDKTPEAEARQVELAPPATPATPPQINDAPPTASNNRPAPATTTRPAPKPVAKSPVTSPPAATPPVATPPVASPPAAAPVPAVRYGMIPAGTSISVRPATKVCTNTNKVGDRIDATIADPITGENGASIPAGAKATLEVVQSQFGNNDADKVRLAFQVVSVSVDGQAYDVAGADVVAPPVKRVRRQSNADQAKKVAIGAAAGAVLGRVLGKGTGSTVAGGVAGAAGGAVVAGGTADYDGCVAADALLTATLTQSLRIRV
ncbi:MAG TPA: hypothetical protein VE967_17830 [Gemmatimonadaceae bacterium]|nr:hypothetical protein [Gemmatimonadaceae bacterium]